MKERKSSRWHLYIIECSDGTVYTGITNDLPRRIEQHNSGKASRYTRSRRPVKLIYKEACRGRSSALKKECRIKALTRKEKEEYFSEASPQTKKAKPKLKSKGASRKARKGRKENALSLGF